MLSHAYFPIEFYDAKGKVVRWNMSAFTRKSYLFNFETLPAKMRARIYLVNQTSIRRVHFKVENIPLPDTTQYYKDWVPRGPEQSEDPYYGISHYGASK